MHELTGFPAAIEDRYGNLSAWAGPGRPDPYPKAPAYDRERLLRRLMTAGRSVTDGDRVVALASPRPGVPRTATRMATPRAMPSWRTML